MKNIKKRLMSLALTITMCLLSVSNAFAAVINTGKITVVKDDFYKLSFVRCSKSYEYGIGGKAKDDQVVKITADASLSEANYYVFTTWSKENYTDYLVMEANLYLTDTCKGFYIGTNTHQTISPAINVNGLARSGQWSKLVVIYDGQNGTTDTYFNGIPVSAGYSTTFNTRVNGSMYNHIRLIINDSIPGSVCYVDDFRLYETDVAPEVTNNLYIIGHEDDSHLTVLENTLFSDAFQVSEPEAELTLFTNNNYTKTKSLDEPLEDGNKLVISHNGEYRTYTIELDDGITLEDAIDDGTMEISKAAGYIVPGMYGKSTSDDCLKVVTDSSAPCFTTYTWLNDTFKGHVLAEFNIMPGDMDSIYIGTNVQMPVSESLKLNARRWNRVSVVYDTESRDPYTGIGKAITYINGVKYCETDTLFTHLTQLRIIMTGATGSYAYIDDFKFEHHAYKAPLIEPMPALADGIEILNGNIMPQEGMKAGELTSADPDDTIKVFTDSLCINELKSDDVLALGNVVVIEDGKGRYSYYTVYEADNINILHQVADTAANLTFNSGKADTVYGLGGKDENDPSFKISVNSGASNCYTDFTWANTAFDGYLVSEFNVLPGTASVSIVTNGNGALSAPLTNIQPLRWNKIVVVTDGKSYDSTTGKYNTYTYVNGVLEGGSATTLTPGGVVRLLVSGDAGSYTYVDDIRIYETATIPMVTVPDLSDKYQIAGERIIFSSDTKPESLSADRLIIKVFTDRNCTTLVENTNIADGNVIVVRDALNTFRYYIAGDNPVKTVLFEAKGAEDIKKNFIDCQYTTESGKYYREPSDTSYKITIASAATSVNAFFNYEYSKQGTDRYVLAETSVYFPEGYEYGTFQICTNQHNPISKTVNIGSSDLPTERWNKVVFAFDKQEKKTHLYINGVEHHSQSYAYFPAEKNNIRFVVYADQGTVVYFDDISIYEADIMPAITKAAVMPDSTNYILYGAMFYASENASVSNLQSWIKSDTATTVRFYRDGQIVEAVSPEDAVPDESTMIIQTEDGHFTSYDIKVAKSNETIMYGTANSSGKLTDGELKIAVATEGIFDTMTAGIAYYKDGKLVDIEQIPEEYFVHFLRHNIKVDTTKYDTIKVFVWEPDNILPRGKNGLLTSK